MISELLPPRIVIVQARKQRRIRDCLQMFHVYPIELSSIAIHRISISLGTTNKSLASDLSLVYNSTKRIENVREYPRTLFNGEHLSIRFRTTALTRSLCTGNRWIMNKPLARIGCWRYLSEQIKNMMIRHLNVQKRLKPRDRRRSPASFLNALEKIQHPADHKDIFPSRMKRYVLKEGGAMNDSRRSSKISKHR